MRKLGIAVLFLIGCGEVKGADIDAPPQVPDAPPGAPRIDSIDVGPGIVDVAQKLPIKCNASDPDGDTLTFAWTTTLGSIEGTGDSVMLDARGTDGNADVTCTVEDPTKLRASSMKGVTISLPRDQLVAYYGFSGNGNDDSGNGLGLNVTTFGPDRRGTANSALALSGTSLPLPISAVFDAQGEYSITFFVTATNLGAGNRGILGKGPNFGNYSFHTLSNQANRLAVAYETATGNFSAIATVKPVSAASLHVAIVFSNNTITTYEDGAQASVVTAPAARLNSSATLLGGLTQNPNIPNMVGTLDEVRFYRRALSAIEVDAIAKSTIH